MVKDKNPEEASRNEDISESVPHCLPYFDESFDCVGDSLPLHDPSMDSIFFDCHKVTSKDMNMCQDQDSSVANDKKDDTSIDHIHCSTNLTLYKVYFDILSFLILAFIHTQLLSFLVDVSPTWGYHASLLTTT